MPGSVVGPPWRDPMLPLRLLVGMLLAAVVTLFLFWIMQYLITTADRPLDAARRGSLVDFVRVKREEAVERRQIKPKKPPAPGRAAARAGGTKT